MWLEIMVFDKIINTFIYFCVAHSSSFHSQDVTEAVPVEPLPKVPTSFDDFSKESTVWTRQIG